MADEGPGRDGQAAWLTALRVAMSVRRVGRTIWTGTVYLRWKRKREDWRVVALEAWGRSGVLRTTRDPLTGTFEWMPGSASYPERKGGGSHVTKSRIMSLILYMQRNLAQ